MYNKQRVVIIVSIIYLSDKRLSYSKVRSVFSPQERAEQTKKTVESIRSKIPGAKIILLESGLNKKIPNDLEKKVDEYVYIGDKKIVRFACDGLFKGLGEIVSLLFLKNNFFKNNIDYFKISGRYFLNDDFILNDWDYGDFNFKFRDLKIFSTVFYKFKGSVIKYFKTALFLTIPFCFLGRPIEHIIFRFIPCKKIIKIKKIGVSGHVSVNGELFNE